MEVPTPRGAARVHLDYPPGHPTALLVLGHGAGGGVDTSDLRAVRDRMLALGAAVARVEQPYRVAGRRAPPPAGHLDEAWKTVVAALRSRPPWTEVPLLAGGRSSAARVACRTAAVVGAAGVLALAFPLHPPGRPDRSRAAELSTVPPAGIPVLVVNGAGDPFGIPEPSDRVTVEVLPGERHPLDRDPAAVATVAAEWAKRLLA